jgi:hypothetical protein
MPAPQPRIHGITHRRGGPDPIPGSGIQFDTYPQTGDWLYVSTTGNSGVIPSYGILLDASDGTGIRGGSLSVEVGPDGIQMDSTDGGGILIRELADGGVHVESHGGGIMIEELTADLTIRGFSFGRIDFGFVDGIRIQPNSGKLLVINNLPTSAPGTSHAVWNNGGVLNIT